jgi:hypothetical protein
VGGGQVTLQEGREGLTENEKAQRLTCCTSESCIMRGRRAEGDVAVNASREELERLNPKLPS